MLITSQASIYLPGALLKIEGYWLASGILGVSASILKRVRDSGADAVVTKSVGPKPKKGHPGPILASSHNGLLNAVGLTNPGIEAFKEEMEQLRKQGVPVILSIFGNTIDDIQRVAHKGDALKPKAIELNRMIAIINGNTFFIFDTPCLYYSRDLSYLPFQY